jgi:hypothetical protein
MIGRRTVCGVHAHDGEEAADVTLTGGVGEDKNKVT